MERRQHGGMDQYLYILPVIFYEFLALSVTRAVLPKLFVEAFGDWVYYAIGAIETIKGALAFVSCPLVGKVSDKVGRKACLLATVVGTTAPVCLLAFTLDMRAYAVAQALSGVCAGTFTLTFAYIADCVEPAGQASAYGLALASLGLSFTVGPVSGGYLARSFGPRAVFCSSLVLALADVAYIIFVLPESKPPSVVVSAERLRRSLRSPVSGSSNRSSAATRADGLELEDDDDEPVLPAAYSPLDALGIFAGDPLLSCVARVTLLYYMGVWAIVSTLMIYLVARFGLSQIYLGYLLGAYGLATMISESLLVRLLVPWLGERVTMRLGLAAFAGQCAVVGFATHPYHIWFSIALSVFSNLVYPSLSSLVSASVPAAQQGEAQGAINGVRALTEGIGPLLFGALMHLAEDSPVPGAPYLAGGLITLWALKTSYELPEHEAYAQWRDARDDALIADKQMERQGLLAGNCDDGEDDNDDEAGTFPMQQHTQTPKWNQTPSNSGPDSIPLVLRKQLSEVGADAGQAPPLIRAPDGEDVASSISSSVFSGGADVRPTSHEPSSSIKATSDVKTKRPKPHHATNAKVWAEAKSSARARREEGR